MTKLSDYKRIIFIFIFVFTFCLFFTSLYKIKDFLVPELRIGFLGQSVIPDKFKICDVDQDCVLIKEGCRPECGYTAINQKYKASYNNMLQYQCQKRILYQIKNILDLNGSPLFSACFSSEKVQCKDKLCVYK